MADPLSIFGAVTGGISVASEIAKALDRAITVASKIKEAPELAVATLREVRMMRVNMSRFYKLLDSEAQARERGICISLNDALDTFTGCVTALDELEDLLKPLGDSHLQPLAMSERLEWAIKDTRIVKLSSRVRDAQASLGFMLTILQHESLLEVHKAISSLSEVCLRIAPNVVHLTRRTSIAPSSIRYRQDEEPDQALQDDIPTSSTLTSFAFEEALNDSRPYRRAPNRDTEVFACRASSLPDSHALSKLSALSPGNVSALSVVALPLFCNDIANPQHYTFGGEGVAMSDGTRETLLRLVDTGPSSQHIQPELLQISTNSPHSSPQSPSTPTKYRPWSILKAIGVLVSRQVAEDNAPLPRSALGHSRELVKRPPSPVPPLSPVPPFIPGRCDIYNPPGIALNELRGIPSMGQMSGFGSWDMEWLLCHSPGSAPCVGAFDRRHEDENILEKAREWSINLAMKKGFLGNFSCKQCKLSLYRIVKEQQEEWDSFEFWCGMDTCLGKQTLYRPCSCYNSILQLGLPSDRYLGCRVLSKAQVQCARCFDLCAGCSERLQSATITNELSAAPAQEVIYWDPQGPCGRLYLKQKRLFEIFDSIWDRNPPRCIGTGEKWLLVKTEDTLWSVRQMLLHRAENPALLAVLDVRQRELSMMAETLPVWTDMAASLQISSTWSTAVRNMTLRMQDARKRLKEMDETNCIKGDWEGWNDELNPLGV